MAGSSANILPDQSTFLSFLRIFVTGVSSKQACILCLWFHHPGLVVQRLDHVFLWINNNIIVISIHWISTCKAYSLIQWTVIYLLDNTVEHFRMTSQRPYWCSKTKKWWHDVGVPNYLPLGIELHFHTNFSFCDMKLTWPLVKRVTRLYPVFEQ